MCIWRAGFRDEWNFCVNHACVWVIVWLKQLLLLCLQVISML